MPRGRHRNPEPLHRLLTPTTVAGVSVASAAAAWLLAEPIPLRLLVALAGAVGVAGAVVMRSWDRAAGRRVAELARERVKDEWKTEERIAELESDLEEARVLRARLDTKLRAKRVELAGLRGEHAALLRRYATAETERASALERRRLLAIEAASAPAASAPKELPPVTEERTSAGAPTAVGYARANAAMAALVRKAEAAHARSAATASVPARRPAATVAPYSPPRRTASRVEGGFDFFGTKTAAQARAVIEAVQNEDLADVVGAEVLAVHKAESAQGRPAEPEFKQPTPEQRAVGQVIDLTAHDETEPIDVVRLRTAIS
ncbi:MULTISPECIES: hypothetical protein [unclassified Streptomyces]|uniref:hypothetical protein n=1 Tax=unclassified Streptomyces TaxID=2593676 RepID=UPI002258D61C|nr:MULTISPECIES: hypothetical protein [unclassified Streptomyces]MCX4527298.1 hypothetical protein [Streptomyces sp. NBC_01551]MCX4542122.1 hypothetical protein [Streptomyces sp. NBC_01565]